MDYARLEKQMEFCKEIDKEKLIGRQTYLTDGSRKENDAEHAWHMALMAVVLQEYSNEEIDLLKSMTDEQKKIFEKYHDCWSKYASLAEAAIFEYAFRLGMQIAIETLK